MKNREQFTFSGRLWVITDPEQRLIDDIDTDQIFHNAHLHITDIQQMGQYTFGNLNGWEDFPAKANPGDIVLAGKNFGAGSSRQQAVDCFRALGIALIMAESFGAIYKRNAINSGFPIAIFPGLSQKVHAGVLRSGLHGRVKLLEGSLHLDGREENFSFTPFSKVQQDIFKKGSLLRL